MFVDVYTVLVSEVLRSLWLLTLTEKSAHQSTSAQTVVLIVKTSVNICKHKQTPEIHLRTVY